ncbi:biliverdin-producing heme oxygenase [Rhizobium sp. SSA_523]|uniref:biliverdin-producing heme oxygenase n=1 Tax=Rhizobium sp. SSA_523 TaxID=2952477 RepID=UPI002091C4F5|nr:biliverdin-producing heme oxygenase [Rhizobium sp. SSA_523]MCO5732300.1 biliverdin-producing heme oxygenase [Rhizobium sp. SSA_523]WKC21298.1 biliverdin-producing heme oxygenase [Rhizobium sp. SSA_523]
MTLPADRSTNASRTAQLKLLTREAHERLDASIMALKPFESRAHYGRFLRVQWALHAMTAELYQDPKLARLLPDLAARCRLDPLGQDLADLDVAPPAVPAAEIGQSEALGWLYVAEGSNLGAAFLLKAAEKSLGLSEDFGARHMAGHPDGRGLRWRSFTGALDAIALPAEAEDAVIAGAISAFATVQAGVEAEMSREPIHS